MSDELVPTAVQYRNRHGMYVISDPPQSNVVVIGNRWPSVMTRAEDFLGVLLPPQPPNDAA
jgi:hypothetical protein